MTSVEAGSVSGPAFIAPGLPDDAQLWIV
ncbi:MAG: hypothetical protein QOJ78_1090, partial [Pseudonocardiales bacterium]|nr:hypothetical protein [Pseudonocardiales bacterium]